MTYDYFISYRRADQALARQLVEALEAQGASVWWDAKIDAGVDWRDAIVDNLVAADTLIILFSEECNDSKQLKKELALADDMNKGVIPVLVEDTKPKGHFLYELAARNWVQIYPNPENKISELAGKLMGISGSTSTSTQSEPAPQVTTETKTVTKTVSKQTRSEGADKPRAKRSHRNFLPFRWFDLPVLIGAPLAIYFSLGLNQSRNAAEAILGSLFYGACIVAAYGAIVFPIRYYLRNLRMMRAARYYLASAVAIYFIGICILATYSVFEGRWHHDLNGLLAICAIASAVLGVVAFIIYGIMHFTRMRRVFDQHLEQI